MSDESIRLQQSLHNLIENATAMQNTIERETFISRTRTSDGESFKLMPETCPILDEIFEKRPAASLTDRSTRLLKQQIKERITIPFRAALQKACADRAHMQRYLANDEVRRNELRGELDQVEKQFKEHNATCNVVTNEDIEDDDL